MTEFRSYNPLIPLAFYGPADQLFRQVIAIALSCINQVYTQFKGFLKHRINFSLFENLAPFSSELPSSNSNDRHSNIRLSQQVDSFREKYSSFYEVDQIVGDSSQVKQILGIVARVAKEKGLKSGDWLDDVRAATGGKLIQAYKNFLKDITRLG